MRPDSPLAGPIALACSLLFACSSAPSADDTPVPAPTTPTTPTTTDAGPAAPSTNTVANPPAPSARGDAAVPSGSDEAEACSSKTPCVAPETGAPTGWQCLRTLDATLRDDVGAPVAAVPVSVCAKNLCTYARSDATGRTHFAACAFLDGPALDFDGHAKYVSFAFALPKDEVIELLPLTLWRLPTNGAELPAEGRAANVASGGATLALTATTKVQFAIAGGAPDEQLFRAVEVPAGKLPGGVPKTLALELFYGLSPARAVVDPPAMLTLRNSRGWPAGAAVEFFLLGMDAQETFAPHGGWKSFGNGRVSRDGATLSTDPGSGLPMLSVVGVRLLGP